MNMKTNQLFWGILLITFGILLFLGQMDIINFSFWSILSFWPLILILVGINLLGINDKAKIVTSIVTSVAVIVVAITVDTRPTFIKFLDERISSGFTYNSNVYDDDQEYSDMADTTTTVYSTSQEPFSQNSPKMGKIKLVCALTGMYEIQGDADFNANKTSESYLYSFVYPDNVKYKIEKRDIRGYREIDIEPYKEQTTQSPYKTDDEKFTLTLNSSIPWTIEIDNIASKINADLTAVNIRELEIKGGTSTKVKFGTLSNCSVDIESPSGSILLQIPKEIGCKIVSENGSYSQIKYEGEGFSGPKTSNYDTAEKKININVASNVDDLKIQQY